MDSVTILFRRLKARGRADAGVSSWRLMQHNDALLLQFDIMMIVNKSGGPFLIDHAANVAIHENAPGIIRDSEGRETVMTRRDRARWTADQHAGATTSCIGNTRALHSTRRVVATAGPCEIGTRSRRVGGSQGSPRSGNRWVDAVSRLSGACHAVDSLGPTPHGLSGI